MFSAAYPVAMLLGLISTVHCLGMCGGIIGALSLGLPEHTRNTPLLLAGTISAYNAGRICSYAIAGALAGSFGLLLISAGNPVTGHLFLQGMAAVILVLLGLHIAGWLPRYNRIEGAGLKLWRLIQPLGKYFLPVDSYLKALLIGMLWGWLPCGLVYSVLLWSVSTADPLAGFGYMLAFGVGTLPGMLTAGYAGGALQRLLRTPTLRKCMGITVVCFGLASPFLVSHGGHALHDSEQQQHQHH
jgi:hypothetical protein